MAKRHSHTLAVAAGLGAALSIVCSGLAAAQPDLVPQLNNPMTASVGVQNLGDTVAGPSHLTINCTEFGQADGGCPDIPGLAAYADPAFPNRVVVDVPQLQPGQSFNHNLTFWNAIAWPAGTFVFQAEADAGNAVAEANEGNNTTQSSHTQQPGVGVAPKAPLPLTGKPAQPKRKNNAAAVVQLALPDLMSTTQGSYIGGDHSAWNQVQKVRPGEVAQTQAGRSKDFCRVPAKFRLMNIGDAPANGFRMGFYVNGQKHGSLGGLSLNAGENDWFPAQMFLKEGKNKVEIRLDDPNNLAEQNEQNNVYRTTVIVPFDCDGTDGRGPKRLKTPTKPVEPKRLQLRPAD